MGHQKRRGAGKPPQLKGKAGEGSPLKEKVNKTKNARNYNDIYKKVNTEKCIYCHDYHLREIIWEDGEQ